MHGSLTHADGVFNLGNPQDAMALAEFLVKAATHLTNHHKEMLSGNAEAEHCRSKQHLRQYQNSLQAHSRMLLWRQEVARHQ